MRRHTWILGSVSAVATLAALAVQAEGDVGGFKTKMAKWVETRQILSQEKSEWVAERETLVASRDLLRQQKKAFEAEIAELDEGSTAADDERDGLLMQRDDYQQGADALATDIRGLEEAVLALAPRLPEPLQKKLEPLLVQIPEDPDHARVLLGQRLMNVLGVLAQAEKWNGTATLVGETRDVSGNGQKVSVRTLYWGLGQAIYVDARAESAGIGRPGAEGWVFTDDPDLADDAARLLDIYEGNIDEIEFVELPVAAN